MFYGSAVTGADVDNDGISDLLIGARGYNGDYLNAGRIALYLGSDEVSGDDDDTGDDDAGDDDSWADDDDTDGNSDSAPVEDGGWDCGGCTASANRDSAPAGLVALLLVGAALLRRRRGTRPEPDLISALWV